MRQIVNQCIIEAGDTFIQINSKPPKRCFWHPFGGLLYSSGIKLPFSRGKGRAFFSSSLSKFYAGKHLHPEGNVFPEDALGKLSG